MLLVWQCEADCTECVWVQGDRGEQEGVCEPGGAAPHDHRHQAPDQLLPGGLLGPGPQGQLAFISFHLIPYMVSLHSVHLI